MVVFDYALYRQALKSTAGDNDDRCATVILRYHLHKVLLHELKKKNWTKTTAAAQFGVKRPRLYELYNQEIDRFSVEYLITLLNRLNKQVSFRINNARRTTIVSRSGLLAVVRTELQRKNWTQEAAAKALDVARPRISEIYRLKDDKFSVELLVRLLFRLNKEVTFKVKTMRP